MMINMATKDEIELVVARLRAIPDEAILSIGVGAPLKREELIKHVEKQDSVGKKVIEMQLFYLRNISKSG